MSKTWRVCVASAIGLIGALTAMQSARSNEPLSIAPPEALSINGMVFSGPAIAAARLQTASVSEDANGFAKSADSVQADTSESEIAAKRLQDSLSSKLLAYFEKEQDRTSVSAFYASRKFTPLWIDGGNPGPKTGAALRFLKNVAADGLDPSDYPVPAFASDPDKSNDVEIALSAAVVRFARHASLGRVAFSRVSGAMYFEQHQLDAGDVLRKIAESQDVASTLDSFNPQTPQYKALKTQLAALRDRQISSPSSTDSKTAHGERRSAKAKGSEANPAANMNTIIANMERWRWMPHELSDSYVMVNIPDYTLTVVQGGKPVWSTKVVVGKPGEQATPLLTETIKYITVNPTWNVPPSIIRNEYLPALARDPNALSRMGLKIGRNKDGSIKIFQPPGEKNALGRIRFNFPNRFLVYQHDTPNKNLFAKSERAFSHGCMRVQNPDQYAEVLLRISQPEEHYSAARVHAMYGDTERTINLKRPIPVYITYQTAFADGAGKLQTRRDVYGLDTAIARILNSDRREADVPVARNYNSSSKPVRNADTVKRRSTQTSVSSRNAVRSDFNIGSLGSN